MKTNKSFSKRIKVTKNGKIMGRKAGQNHFNAKDSGSKGQHKKRMLDIVFSNKAKARFLPGRFK
ncbi:MAG: 50S ribosomal protein L35 [Candidatus Paceibacterota bacterium]|jgi:ribosomal protein L35